jgi:hypothetical protein
VIVGNPGQRSRQAACTTDIRPEGSAGSGNAADNPPLGVDDPGFCRVVANATHDVWAVRDVSGIGLPYGVPARELTAPGGHTAIALVGLRGDEGQTEHLAARLTSTATARATASVRLNYRTTPMRH